MDENNIQRERSELIRLTRITEALINIINIKVNTTHPVDGRTPGNKKKNYEKKYEKLRCIACQNNVLSSDSYEGQITKYSGVTLYPSPSDFILEITK